MATAVTNIYDLQFIQDFDLLDESFVQTANIDVSPVNPSSPNYDEYIWGDGTGFRPIGNLTNPFTGTYDGQGYTIDSLFILRSTSSDYVGLFGVIDGVCRRILLTNIDVKSTANAEVGGLAGRVHHNGRAEQCGITGGYVANSTTSTTMGTWVGGFVGNLSGYCKDCYTSNLSVDNKSQAANATSGGFVGLLGLGGTLAGTRMAERCYVLGANVYGKYVGVFVGVTQSGDAAGLAARVRDCYARDNASGRTDVGSTIVGGFIALSFHGVSPNVTEYSRCYVVATASGDTVQAFCGSVSNPDYADFTGCYYDADVASPLTDTNTGVSGKSTAQMKTKDIYTGWNFTTLWDIKAGINDGYPFLNPRSAKYAYPGLFRSLYMRR